MGAAAAWAQSPDVAPPRPRPYAGVLALAVDATDLDHRVWHVRETIPVTAAGPLTLLYPKWFPGHHGPDGDVGRVAGLQIGAAGRPLAWRRDPLDPHAFHVDVPAGVPRIEVEFDFIGGLDGASAQVGASPAMLNLKWIEVLFYPAGHESAQIRFHPRLRLPAGWQQASALRAAGGALAAAAADGWTDYAELSLQTLADSPVYAGSQVRRIELDPPGAAQPVALDVFGDDAAAIEASAAQIDAHRALVVQADRLFGPRHFRHYDFLLGVSDRLDGQGLEHHESSENGVQADYFKDWDKAARERTLLPHEYVHSWNGKYRRPADLDTPQFNVPMQNSLLWAYEGMTEYWGDVLTARSALATPEQLRVRIAYSTAWLDTEAGRRWRNLQDTTNSAVIHSALDGTWPDWQRGYEYYAESALIWLDADTLIRERSGGRRSLDDFARAFFGRSAPAHPDGSIAPLTYTFDDVVAALNAVQAADWAQFLRERLDGHGPGAPLAGLERSGWRLVWREQESEFAKNAGGRGRGHKRPSDFAYSIGVTVDADGKLALVRWKSPAFDAGLAPGQTLVAVNQRAYDSERLAAAISANKDGRSPIRLLVRSGDHYREVTVDWRGGLRYPALERIEGRPDLLGAIWQPR